MAQIFIAFMLFFLFFTIVANGFKNRKYIDLVEKLQYAFFLIVIGVVIIFLLDNIKIQQLWVKVLSLLAM